MEKDITLAAEMMYKDLPRKFIDEWVSWHDYLGFDKLFILDHFSKEPLIYDHPKVSIFHASSHLDDIKPFGNPEYKYITMSWWWEHLRSGEAWDWMAFIDSDEFVMIPYGDNVKEVIENTGGDAVFLNWKNFGPEDYEKDPDNTLFSYDRFIYHHATKVIARKDALVQHLDIQNCHLPKLNGKAKLVTSGGQEIKHECYDVGDGKACWDNLWLNHYHLRSREDWYRKQKSMEHIKDEMPWYWEEGHFEACQKTASVDRTVFDHRQDYDSKNNTPIVD